MCQTTSAVITRILLIQIIILISPIIQPSYRLVHSAEFGETCNPRPKSGETHTKQKVEQLQIPVPIPASDNHDRGGDSRSQLLLNSAEFLFDAGDYVTYENINHFPPGLKLQVANPVQIARSSRQRDDQDESYQTNYVRRINKQGFSSSSITERKTDNQFQIGLIPDKYRETSNELKIGSTPPQLLSPGNVAQQKNGGEANQQVYEIGLQNDNFKHKLEIPFSNLLRPRNEETFVDNTVTNELTEKTLTTELFNGDDEVTTFLTEIYLKTSLNFETTSESPLPPTTSTAEVITQPISELTTIPVTTLDMTFSDLSSSPISGPDSGTTSQDFKLISSTFSSSTQNQEMTTAQSDRNEIESVATSSQQQTPMMESRGTTFTGESSATQGTKIAEPSFGTPPINFATGSITPQPSPLMPRSASSLPPASTGSDGDRSIITPGYTSVSRLYSISTTVAAQVGESTGESYTSNEPLSGSTTTKSTDAQSTNHNNTDSDLNMTWSTTPGPASDTTPQNSRTTLSDTSSSSSTRFDPTTSETIMGTTHVEDSSVSTSLTTLLSFISTSNLNLQSQTSSRTNGISISNTDPQNMNSLPSTESMTSYFSNDMNKSPTTTESESPSSLPANDANSSPGSETLSPKSTTTPLTPTTGSQITDKTIIDFSVTNNSPDSFTFSATTTSTQVSSLQPEPESEISITGQTNGVDIETVSMSTAQVSATTTTTFETGESSHTPKITTPSSDLDEDNQFCHMDGWLECDISSLTCRCPEGMSYDKERSTCVSNLEKECQTGNGGKSCVKNALCSSKTIGQVGICQCMDGFLPGKDGICLPGLGFSCDISNSSSSSCYPGMKCIKNSSNSSESGPTCSCREGWTEGKPGGLRCFLDYNAKCALSDNLCNSFTFLNCSDTMKECKCEDPANQVYDAERKACVAIFNAKCMLKDDLEGRRLQCGKKSECKRLKSGENPGNEAGICECIMEHENDWKGNCHRKNGGNSAKNGMTGGIMALISLITLKINHVIFQLHNHNL